MEPIEMKTALWLGGVVLAACAAAAQAQAVPAANAQDQEPGASAPASQRYWLGVEFLPVIPPLRAQLNLADREGLLVEMVSPGSPAAGGGIQQYDVLLRAGDQRLAAPRDLIEALDASGGAKLKIELLRGGKPRTIEVLPAPRPEGLAGATARPAEPSDWDTIQRWMEGMWVRENAQVGSGQLRLARPRLSRPLPSEMSVVVSKHGDQPAKIAVERGAEKWNVLETELDKLPADVRPLVEQSLGWRTLDLFGPAGAGMTRGPSAGGGQADRLGDRLDAIDLRLERLTQAVEQLRRAGSGPKAEKK
jgi:hypothetical protein